MEHDRVLYHIHSVDNYTVPHWRQCADKSGREIAVTLTKQAMGMVILSCSLGLWAAIWTVAASMASAWLQ